MKLKRHITNLDTRTGVQSFGWSGLDALFSDQEFGLFINEPYKTKLKGVDGPYIFDNVKYQVNQKNELKKNTGYNGSNCASDFGRLVPRHFGLNCATVELNTVRFVPPFSVLFVPL